jgi:hypothetical protein
VEPGRRAKTAKHIARVCERVAAEFPEWTTLDRSARIMLARRTTVELAREGLTGLTATITEDGELWIEGTVD